MIPIVFLPGFDGDASLRGDFLDAMRAHHPLHAVSYPLDVLGSLQRYRDHAMAQVPVDWRPVLVAESFSGLVAARWAAEDSRIAAVVLCGSFARNPVGLAASLGASFPSLVKRGPALFAPIANASGDAARKRWSAALSRTMGQLPEAVVAERLRLIAAEDVGSALASLAVPLVLVQFDGDQVIGAGARAHLEAVCHNARVLRLPGPHFALETRPTECAAAIGACIRELSPRQA